MDSLELSPLQQLPLVRGAIDAPGNGPGPVTRVQELLCWAAWRNPGELGRCATAIDGDYGPATQAAVEHFQRQFGHVAGVEPTGGVDAETWNALHAPLKALLARRTPGNPFSNHVVSIGNEWLALRPCEFRGKGQGNMGPIVRAVMTRPEQRGKTWGPEGDSWPWCAGAVSTLIALAAEAHGVEVPFPYSVYCPEMGVWATRDGRLIRGENAAARNVKPGDIFLCKPMGGGGMYPHTGIVGGPLAGGRFRTLEGNSDPAGGYNGIAFLERTRAVASCDFISI